MSRKILTAAALVLVLAALAAMLYARLGEEDNAAADAGTLQASPTPDAPPEPTPETTPAPTPTPEPTPTPTPSPTPEPTPYRPDIDITSWEYMLVNKDNPIGEYEPELTELEGGQQFDSRAVEALQSFIDAARAEGLSVYLSSSYRSYAEQSWLFERKVNQYGGDEETAATIVSRPGTSEHQTGLCCDITDRYYELKDASLENTALYRWMSAHCHEYGFIVRYPKDKQEVTGIIYEPWHFRYVGVEAAAFMMENGICLEEFHELYK